MPVSRLRLKLSGGFAIAFSIGLSLLATVTLGYLWRESNRRFDRRLEGIVAGAATGLERELEETPDSSLSYVAQEVVSEWPRNGDRFLVSDSTGRILASLDQENLSTQLLLASSSHSRKRLHNFDEEPALRAFVVDTIITSPSVSVEARIVAFGSSEGIERDTETLAALLLVSMPLIALISLLAGYLLSGRALQPVRELAASVAGIVPSDLSRRLVTEGSKDELGTLASEFNSLLERLEIAQKRNRRFVREAAHQIRTPLTLVLGESEHALASEDDNRRRLRDAIGRIRLAGEQMRRRVDELFLLAEAEAGESVRLEEDVELDGLLLECMDLMRSRATDTGHRLAIDKADAGVIRGNASLLREAVLELLENACRYGTTGTTISASVVAAADSVTLIFRSAGKPFSLPSQERNENEAMGLSIVQWVAISHRGHVSVLQDGQYNQISLRLPLLRQNA